MADAIMPALVALIGVYWLIRRKKATEGLLMVQQKYVNGGKSLSSFQTMACRIAVPAISITAVVLGGYDAISALLN